MDASALLKSYQQTDYRVEHCPTPIRIGVYNPLLDAILSSSGSKQWAIITAYNPLSKICTEYVNIAANEALKPYIQPFTIYNTIHIPLVRTWPKEMGYFVLGIPKMQAMALAEKFNQFAIVYGHKNLKPELCFTKHFEGWQ